MKNEYNYLRGHITEILTVYDRIQNGIRGRLDSEEEYKLVTNALRDSFFMTLWRIYDSYLNSGHLYSFLKETHLDDELMNLLSYDNAEPVVQKLRNWRNWGLAHIW